MKGSHCPISDEQTKHLRKVLRARINTSHPFGNTRSYRQEWSARIAARDFLDEMEIDIYSGTLNSPSDHKDDMTQSVTQISRPNQSAVQPSISAKTPIEELKAASESQATPVTPQSTDPPATAGIGNVCKTTTTSHHSSDGRSD